MTMVGGGEQVEIVSAHALADVRRRVFARPHYLADTPIAVDPQTWHQAQGELRHVLELRGWPLLASDKVDLPNFLLCGVAVVMTRG
jgi:hypothetical protein